MKNRKTMQNEKIQKNKEKGENNYAFIDGANLYKGVSDLGWKLDYARLRVWLTEKYNVKMAYIFNDQRFLLEIREKEKAPDGDKTP